MTRARRKDAHHEADETTAAHEEEGSRHAGRRNGAHDRSDNGAGELTPADSAAAEQPESVRRAEELVDRIGERIGHYASLVGHTLLRWASRVREEAEDIYAEAQEVRRRRQQQS